VKKKLSKFFIALFMITFTLIGNFGQETTNAQKETKESFGCQIASGRSTAPSAVLIRLILSLIPGQAMPRLSMKILPELLSFH